MLAHAGFREGRTIRLRETDARILARQIPDITMISPEYSTREAPVRRGPNGVSPNITGIHPVYGEMRNIFPLPGGRFINERDQEERRRVVFLGNEVAGVLFGDRDPVGEQVRIGDSPFTVIGRKYRFDPQDEDALEVWDTAEWERMFGFLFLGFKLFFAIVGCFTLSVGGIGVANIMYIVVQERTSEIGIKRSVGATQRSILWQFLAESVLIVALGAALGVLASAGIVKVVSLFPMNEIVGTPTILAPGGRCDDVAARVSSRCSPGCCPLVAPRRWILSNVSVTSTGAAHPARWSDRCGRYSSQRFSVTCGLTAPAPSSPSSPWCGARSQSSLLLAFGQGLRNQISVGLLNAGERIFMVYGGQTSLEHEGLSRGRRIRLREDDLDLVLRAIPEFEFGSPSYGRGRTHLEAGENQTTTYMEGVNPIFSELRRMFPAPGGRFINQRDLDQRRRVLFLGDEIAARLFGDTRPVGQTVPARRALLPGDRRDGIQVPGFEQQRPRTRTAP